MSEPVRLSLEGRNPTTENDLRVIQFQHPKWIPAHIGLLSGTWQKYREALEEIVLRHPRVFPGYRKGSRDFDDLGHVSYACSECEDAWGCRWENLAPGMVGQPVTHPLEDWDALASYRPPDLLAIDDWGVPRDWDAIARGLDRAQANGGLRAGGASTTASCGCACTTCAASPT